MSFYITAVEAQDRLVKGEVKILGHGQHGNQGKRQGTEHKRLSPEVKESVAILAKLIGNKNTEQVTGIDRSTVGKYAKGKGSDGEVEPGLKERVEARLEGIHDKTTQAIEQAVLRLLEPSRLDSAKARDLAGIASNLASVLEKTRGKSDVVVAGSVIIMAPKTQKKDNYQVIDVESRVLD